MTDIDIKNTEVSASLTRMRELSMGALLHPDLAEHPTDTRDATPEEDTLIGEIMRLRTALTASIAREAAAVEVAAVKVDGYANVWNDRDINGSSISVIARDVRRSTPADAQAALDRMIADARADGMREAARVVLDLQLSYETILGVSEFEHLHVLAKSDKELCEKIHGKIIAKIGGAL